jgi:hypothetical protein
VGLVLVTSALGIEAVVNDHGVFQHLMVILVFRGQSQRYAPTRRLWRQDEACGVCIPHGDREPL